MSIQTDFAPSGTLRVGINLGNPVIAQRGPEGGEPRGVGSELGRELARRLGLPVAFVTFETAGKMADAVKQGAWDVAFLAVDPDRAGEIDFSDGYVHIEGTYMVRDESPLRGPVDVDRPHVKVAVGDKTAYDLWLTRNLKHADIVRHGSSNAAVDAFLAGGHDAVAGVRQPLEGVARKHPGLRVMPESFMVIRQASGVPKGRGGAHAYLDAFIEEAKRTGLVKQYLDASGISGASVAPAKA